MSERTVEIIEAEITELKKKISTVKGRPTEVYTRIVGYYRPVNRWNAGKRAELTFRRPFNLPTTADIEKLNIRGCKEL